METICYLIKQKQVCVKLSHINITEGCAGSPMLTLASWLPSSWCPGHSWWELVSRLSAVAPLAAFFPAARDANHAQCEVGEGFKQILTIRIHCRGHCAVVLTPRMIADFCFCSSSASLSLELQRRHAVMEETSARASKCPSASICSTVVRCVPWQQRGHICISQNI